MRFRVDQRFNSPPDLVLATYTDPEFYAALSGLAKVSTPEVLSHERTGDRVRIRVRYAFTADLPAAATTVIDPNKLTWVDDTTYDLAELTSTTRLNPDHYPDRLVAAARSTFAGSADEAERTSRRIEGDLNVRMPFVGGQVERAILSGLREHLEDEEDVADDWLRRRH